ncbi:MAG TPA: ABC transporter permease [Mycobacteriales bacterium]|nr:ABC transporter permease [Mycobacteriales bacterium]
MSRWSGRGAVLRLARRDARRHRARSALVIAMIALPVLGLSAVDVVARTSAAGTGAPGQYRLTAQSDAVVTWFGGQVQQTPDAQFASSDGDQPEPPDDEQVRRDSGAAQVLRQSLGQGRLATADDRTFRVDLVELDYTAPLAEGLVRQVSGRAPAAPGEVALTPAAALAAGAQVGDAVRLHVPARDLTVVGTVEVEDADRRTVVGPPGTLLDEALGGPSTTWLLGATSPVTWEEVLALNDLGYVVVSKAVLADPPPDAEVPFLQNQPQGDDELDAVAFVVLAAGMGLLEVVLLAGPAFAVGARRSRRVLALVAACGGDRRQVRDVVLAQGLVLGVVGAGTGVGLGVAAGIAALPALNRWADAELGGAVVRPLDLLGIAAVGVVTAVLAALLPARSVSRQDVALALSGRREPVRTRRRVPVVGLGLALLGLAVTVTGVNRRSPVTILSGAALGQVGLVLCTPTIVRLVGHLARWLPLTPRLAVRDSARNVGRTAPAVAAVMAAVAGTVAAGIFVASLSERDERQYTEALPVGQVQVSVGSGLAPGDLDAVDGAVRAVLPVERSAALVGVDYEACDVTGCATVALEPPDAEPCPLDRPGELTEEQRAAAVGSPACAVRAGSGQSYLSPFAVDDGSGLGVLLGVDDPDAARVLRAGGVVVFDPSVVRDGQVRLRVTRFDGGEDTSAVVPAVALPAPRELLPGLAVMDAPLAERLDLSATVRDLRYDPGRVISAAEEERLLDTLDAIGADASVYVERGYVDRYGPGLIALVVGAALVTIGAVATSTALAMTDARPDLATMSAVGATRWVRRRMSMVTALVLALLGTALGVVAGAVPGIAAIKALRSEPAFSQYDGNDWPLVIPWTSLLVTAVAVPLLAGLLVALFTRSRLPVVHRRTS